MLSFQKGTMSSNTGVLKKTHSGLVYGLIIAKLNPHRSWLAAPARKAHSFALASQQQTHDTSTPNPNSPAKSLLIKSFLLSCYFHMQSFWKRLGISFQVLESRDFPGYKHNSNSGLCLQSRPEERSQLTDFRGQIEN